MKAFAAFLILLAIAASSSFTTPAQPHLAYKPKRKTLEARERSQERNLSHARYVASYGKGRNASWHKKAQRWISRELAQTRRILYPPKPKLTVGYWIARQIWAANQIGASSNGDPWPNCPDPYDGGGSWQATVNCENGGNWMDSPGYYRCGLQFDPMWERKYGRLCP